MPKQITTIFKFIDLVTEKVGNCACLIALPIMLIIAIEVISRYFFNNPTVWAWPVNKQLFGVLSLFGGAYALLHDRHVRVEVLYERFGPKLKLASHVLTVICFLFFIGVLVWQGYFMAEMAFSSKESLSGPFHMPLYPLKLLIPLAALLFLIQGIAIFFKRETKASSE